MDYLDNFEKYVENYLKENCEEEEVTFIAISGNDFEGWTLASKDEPDAFNFDCIAYLEERGIMYAKQEKLFFTFYVKDVVPNQPEIKKLTTYQLTCRKFKAKNLYYVLDAKEVDYGLYFNDFLEKYLKTAIVLSDGTNKFVYNNRDKAYLGNIKAIGKKIKIRLDPESSDGTDASTSFETYKILMKDLDNLYHKVIKRCGESLVKIANEWRYAGDTHEITKEEIERKIDKDSFFIYIDGEDYTFYFDDDDLFACHAPFYDGNINNDEYYVDFEDGRMIY